MAIVTAFPSGPFGTNALVISCQNTLKALIVDPAPGSAKEILEYLNQNSLTPTAIALTHSHLDHIGDLELLKSTLKVPVWAHHLDAPNVEQPGADGLPLFFEVTPSKVDAFLEEGQVMEVGKLRFRVIHTPGHSPGGLCFYEEQEQVLISGDTLFRGSIGNLSFPTADEEAMWDSLDKLAKLPPNTRVYPGHGEETVLKEETWLPKAREFFGH